MEFNKVSITLLFADDQVIITASEENLQRITYTLHLIFDTYNMMATDKTKVIAFDRKEQVRAKVVIHNNMKLRIFWDVLPCPKLNVV
jgi:hypothetical protein